MPCFKVCYKMIGKPLQSIPSHCNIHQSIQAVLSKHTRSEERDHSHVLMQHLPYFQNPFPNIAISNCRLKPFHIFQNSASQTQEPVAISPLALQKDHPTSRHLASVTMRQPDPALLCIVSFAVIVAGGIRVQR